MNSEKLRMLQAQKNITNRQLAIKTNRTPNYISDLRGGRATPSMKMLTMLAEALGVEVKELL